MTGTGTAADFVTGARVRGAMDRAGLLPVSDPVYAIPRYGRFRNLVPWPRPTVARSNALLPFEHATDGVLTDDALRAFLSALQVIPSGSDGFPVHSHPFHHELAADPLPKFHAERMVERVFLGFRCLDAIAADPSGTSEDSDRALSTVFHMIGTPAYLLELFLWCAAFAWPRVPAWVGPQLLNAYTQSEIFQQARADEFALVLRRYRASLRYTLDNLPPRKNYRLFHGVEYDTTTAGDGLPYVPRSWTLRKDTAKFFARRFSPNNPRPVLTTMMSRAQLERRAVFYTDDRGESEVYFSHDPRTHR